MTDTRVQIIASEVEALVAATKAAAQPRIVDLTADNERLSEPAAPVLLRPLQSGFAVESIRKFVDEWRTEPDRRRGVAKMTTLESFCAHVNRFKDADSAVFADVDNDDDEPSASLVAVLDYHRGGDGAPRFGEHRCFYEFPLSEEWQAWQRQDGTPMSQGDFAAFIEDRILDVADPAIAGASAKSLLEVTGGKLASAGELMALKRGLSVRVASKVAHAVELSSGETQITYETQHTDERGAPLKVPAAFLIAIPVFRSGARYQIPVRLRYRVSGGITWSVELYRPELVFDHAIAEACEVAKAKTELPLFYGTPEA